MSFMAESPWVSPPPQTDPAMQQVVVQMPFTLQQPPPGQLPLPPQPSSQVQPSQPSSQPTPSVQRSMSASAASSIPPSTTTSLSLKTAMPSSALPNASELSQEDDWTKVKDPKEKKRIQNRVAQRTYRHRMKARLGELQARLESHEGRARSQSSASTSITPPFRSHSSSDQSIPPPFRSHSSSDQSIPPPSNHMSPSCSLSPTQYPTTYGTTQHPSPPHPVEEESPSPMSGLFNDANRGSTSVPMGVSANIYDQPVDDTDPAMFPQAPSRILNSPPHSQASPAQNDLMSSPARATQTPAKQEASGSQDWMMDCLKFQTNLLNHLHTMGAEADYAQNYITTDGVQSMLNTTSQAEQANAMAAFAQSQKDAMDYAFDPNGNLWKSEPRQGPSPAETLNYVSSSSAPGNAQTSMLDSTPDLPPPTTAASMSSMSAAAGQAAPTAPMDQRFGDVMRSVEAAGFESFDALVTAYYSHTFGDASPLAEEQRLSRNRRLPKVIADVSQAAASWSTWEQRGFHEEILKTAESMVKAEGLENRNNVLARIGPMIESYEGPSQCTPEAINSIKKAVQSDLPNSWALTMALAADNRASWQRDRSNTALASILLFKFSGRIPNEQLLNLLGSCLA